MREDAMSWVREARMKQKFDEKKDVIMIDAVLTMKRRI